jgi:hypothetical protein
MKLLGTLQKRSVSNPVPAKIVVGLLSIFALATFACSILAPKTTATATPTGQIGAIEIGTPEMKGNKKDFGIWTGTITSQTSGNLCRKERRSTAAQPIGSRTSTLSWTLQEP